jgi:Tfp pilus assembly protein FimT
VELLIVLAIVGTIVSLVAPLGVRQFERTKAQEEWLVLDRTLSGVAFAAFVQDAPITLEASGRKLSWTRSGDEKPTSIEFEQLSFDRQIINFNANGLAAQSELRLRQRERARVIRLNQGFER